MKTEFVTLSPVGLIALIVSGVLFAQADLMGAMLGILALAVVRENANEPFASGSYKRRWCIWTRSGEVTSDEKSGNIVPFKGPAA
jgi:hypothetical protein